MSFFQRKRLKKIALALFTITILGSAGVFAWQIYRHSQQLTRPTVPTPSPNQASGSTEFCELNKEYESSVENPTTCQCPDGYTLEVISKRSGEPCPQSGMTDCPVSKLRCAKQAEPGPRKCLHVEKSLYAF